MTNENGWWNDPPTPAALASNPEAYPVPDVEEGLEYHDAQEKTIDGLTGQLDDVESIERTMIDQRGVNQQLAVDMESIAPGAMTAHMPLGSWTADYSLTNLKISQEVISLTKADLQQKVAQHHAGSLSAHMTYLVHWLGQKDKLVKNYTDTVAKIGEKGQTLNMNIADVMTKTRSDKASVDAMIEHFNAIIPGDKKIEPANDAFVNKLSVINSFMDAFASDRLGKYFSSFIYRVVSAESDVTEIFDATGGLVTTAVPSLLSSMGGDDKVESPSAVWATLKQTISGFAKNIKQEQSPAGMASALNVYLQEQMREAVDPSKLQNYVARASYGESPLHSLGDNLGSEIGKQLKAIEGLGADSSPEARVHALKGAADDWTTVYFLSQFLLSANDVIQGFMTVHLELLDKLTEALGQASSKFEGDSKSADDADAGAQAVDDKPADATPPADDSDATPPDDAPTDPDNTDESIKTDVSNEGLAAALGVRRRSGLFG
jgi:hypothetical protein